MNKQWPNDSIPLCFKPKNYKSATNGFRTSNHTNDRPRDCLRATPLYAHTHTRIRVEGRYASIKRTLILLVKSARKRRTKTIYVFPLRKLENDFSLLFLLGISAGTTREKRDISQEKFSWLHTMNCRIHLANPSRKFPFILGQD